MDKDLYFKNTKGTFKFLYNWDSSEIRLDRFGNLMNINMVIQQFSQISETINIYNTIYTGNCINQKDNIYFYYFFNNQTNQVLCLSNGWFKFKNKTGKSIDIIHNGNFWDLTGAPKKKNDNTWILGVCSREDLKDIVTSKNYSGGTVATFTYVGEILREKVKSPFSVQYDNFNFKKTLADVLKMSIFDIEFLHNSSTERTTTGSFYFKTVDEKCLIRVSDHWYDSNDKNVNKVGNLKTSQWYLKTSLLNKPRYSNSYKVGIVEFEKMKKIKDSLEKPIVMDTDYKYNKNFNPNYNNTNYKPGYSNNNFNTNYSKPNYPNNSFNPNYQNNNFNPNNNFGNNSYNPNFNNNSFNQNKSNINNNFNPNYSKPNYSNNYNNNFGNNSYNPKFSNNNYKPGYINNNFNNPNQPINNNFNPNFQNNSSFNFGNNNFNKSNSPTNNGFNPNFTNNNYVNNKNNASPVINDFNKQKIFSINDFANYQNSINMPKENLNNLLNDINATITDFCRIFNRNFIPAEVQKLPLYSQKINILFNKVQFLKNLFKDQYIFKLNMLLEELTYMKSDLSLQDKENKLLKYL